ncbi:hypothetical protein [Lacrimispora sp.]|uniref:hypothetical protein n=1 Tax=Lacrimispora sp. TaxID=2719234 RepID=UPI0028AE4C91|nr:hypothetical protein [Lacrimispora sp.]
MKLPTINIKMVVFYCPLSLWKKRNSEMKRFKWENLNLFLFQYLLITRIAKQQAQ